MSKSSKEDKKKNRKGFRALAEVMAKVDAPGIAPDFDLPFGVDEPAPMPVNKAVAKRAPDAIEVVVGSAFEAAMGRADRRRLAHKQALAVVVIVPTAAWVFPVKNFMELMYGSRFRMHARDGVDRRYDKTKGSDGVAADLTAGRCVMGIAASIDLIPLALATAADVTIRISAPDGEVLRRAIARFTKRSPGDLPAGLAAGLDLPQIVAAFRPGTGPKDIVSRLQNGKGNAVVVGDRVPDLATAIEYGDARSFGLELARDIADLRAGRVGWESLNRGICVHSEPGLGKTILARMVATACGIPLVTTSVAQWFASGAGYLDTVIKAQRAAYAEAAALANPCALLHVDELEALPSRAGLSSSRGRDFWLPLITDALLLMDSSLSSRGPSHGKFVVIMGSTNHIDQVDPALLRPGRLEKVVELVRPDAAGAANILKFHLADDAIEGDMSRMGSLLEGFTGAEIMYAVRTARRAARHAGRALTAADIENAVVPPIDVNPARLRRMAIHEAAHAVAALALGAGTVDKVALRNDGASGGRTVIGHRNGDLAVAADIEDRVVVGLAARAAEALLCRGGISTGSGGSPNSDIGAATAMIAGLHASFGLGENLVYLGAGDEVMRELGANPALRDRVERHLRQLQDRAAEVVAANRGAVLAVAEVLAAKRHLDGGEVAAIVDGLLVRFAGKDSA
jgi:cell division protease FtsH